MINDLSIYSAYNELILYNMAIIFHPKYEWNG